MQLVILIVLISGLVLVWAAVKGEDPRELIKKAINRGE